MNEYEKMSKDELLTRCIFLEEVLKERDEQIEKMKCCSNCIHSRLNKGVCYRGNLITQSCENMNKWELVEE